MTVNAKGLDQTSSTAIATDAVVSTIHGSVKGELGRNKLRKKLHDNNAIVKEGTVVAGRFIKKLDRKMVVSYKIGSKKCSGILDVCQFPSSDRSTRDKMFELAKVGHLLFRLKVIQVIPPSGEHLLTRVYLTAREDFDEQIYRTSSMAKQAGSTLA